MEVFLKDFVEEKDPTHVLDKRKCNVLCSKRRGKDRIRQNHGWSQLQL